MPPWRKKPPSQTSPFCGVVVPRSANGITTSACTRCCNRTPSPLSIPGPVLVADRIVYVRIEDVGLPAAGGHGELIAFLPPFGIK